jgi:RNA polymerase sigma-70 factor (ECF subfamily)
MNDKIKKLSDAELLGLYAKGSEDAFQEVVTRYKNGLYMFLKRFLGRQDVIEDVLQETFLQLFNSYESFDTDRPLRPWLFTIAANKAKDALRKQQRTAAMPIGTISDDDEMSFNDVLNAISSDDKRPYEGAEKSETAELVREVVNTMPQSAKEILILAYFNKFSYKQMSQILSIPIGTVKSRLHTAVARFAKEYKAALGSRTDK